MRLSSSWQPKAFSKKPSSGISTSATRQPLARTSAKGASERDGTQHDASIESAAWGTRPFRTAPSDHPFDRATDCGGVVVADGTQRHSVRLTRAAYRAGHAGRVSDVGLLSTDGPLQGSAQPVVSLRLPAHCGGDALHG